MDDVHGMKSNKQFVNTLLDVMRRRGPVDKLISDEIRHSCRRDSYHPTQPFHVAECGKKKVKSRSKFELASPELVSILVLVVVALERFNHQITGSNFLSSLPDTTITLLLHFRDDGPLPDLGRTQSKRRCILLNPFRSSQYTLLSTSFCFTNGNR